MNYSNYRITLEVQDSGSNTVLTAKRGDTGRKLYVTLTDGGLPYRLTEDCMVVFTARKPDGHVVFNHCAKESNTVVYNITEQTLSAAGLANCEIRVYAQDGMLLTSASFSLLVEVPVYNDGDEIESTDEFNALTKLLAELLKLKEEFEGWLGLENGSGDNVIFINKFVTELIENKTVVNQFSEELSKNEEVINKFIEQVLKDERVSNTFVEEVIYNETVVNEFVENLLKEDIIVQQFVEEVIKNETVVNSFLEEITTNEYVTQHFIETVLGDEIFINNFIEEVVKTDNFVDQFVDFVVNDSRTINTFIDSAVNNESVVTNFIQQILGNELVFEEVVKAAATLAAEMAVDPAAEKAVKPAAEMAVAEIVRIMPLVREINLSGFWEGSFFERTATGEVINHTVIFDHAGRPSVLDGTELIWEGEG